jgi:hypothetical protein
LRNSGVTVRAKRGRVSLSPPAKATPELRMLVARHKAELLAELERWPGGCAPARNYFVESPRRDELGLDAVRRPQVVTLRKLLSRRR